MSNFGIYLLQKSLKTAASDIEYCNSSVSLNKQNELTEASIAAVTSLKELDTEAHRLEVVVNAMIEKYKSMDDFEIPITKEDYEKLFKKIEKTKMNETGDTAHFQNILDSLKRGLEGDEEEPEDEDADQSQDGMQVMQIQHSRKDPISKKDIVNPVIYKPCGHVYDRDSIKEFAGKKRQIKCAMQGCSQTITISRLEDYPDYWNNIKQQL
ncbi:Protein CBG02509 [Caenorhabditis briggsae]|uniref:E3 SUMO-protein ligase NSE2 n=2 Tax=Caenorhabditis briggsae TaxID=6238 RepID=A8WU55_CAEBR|nr:Protein CBG02509 [Caenorhabditis briggsae]ULU06781.1 hypothetical protein L3Y34_018525 [Caenorhabditis briggsae]CAP24017.1 Protein CBG02509 [Caenorhabditis briggsae]